MKIKLKKLTALMLVLTLGLSINYYPVFATDLGNEQTTNASTLQEIDETAVLIMDKTDMAESKDNQTDTILKPIDPQPNQKAVYEDTLDTIDTVDKHGHYGDNTFDRGKETTVTWTDNVGNRTRTDSMTGDFVVEGGTYGIDYRWDNDRGYGRLLILTSKQLTISSVHSGPISHSIHNYPDGQEVNIILKNLEFDWRFNVYDSKLRFWGGGTLTILGDMFITPPQDGGIFSVRGDLTIRGDMGTNLVVIPRPRAYGRMFLSVHQTVTVSGVKMWVPDQYELRNTYLDLIDGASYACTRHWYGMFPDPEPISLDVRANSIELHLKQVPNAVPVFSLNGGEWQTGSSFPDLPADTEFTVRMKYGENEYGLESAIVQQKITTLPAQFTITIPSSMEVGTTGYIAVDTSYPFELGHGGEVNVKLVNGIDSDGYLQLSQKDGEETITSALLVDENTFTSIGDNVATFTATSNASVPISFATPTEKNLPAGRYEGTVTFEISYGQ